MFKVSRLLFILAALALSGCCTSDRCVAVTTSNLMHDAGTAAAETIRLRCTERYTKASLAEIARLDVGCLPASDAYDDFVAIEAKLVALLVANADDRVRTALDAAQAAGRVLAEKIGAVLR